jgi:hypothetical protein
MTNRDFASLIGRDNKTITNWRRKGMPAPTDDCAGAVRWVVDHAGDLEFTDMDARQRWEQARADKLELANSRTRSQLVPLVDIKVIAAEVGAIFAGRLEGLAGRLANELAGITEPGLIRERIRFETTRIRKAVADRLALLGSVSGDGGADQATTDKKPGRVGKGKPRTAARKRRAGSVQD